MSTSYADGARVRDMRTGATGTVKYHWYEEEEREEAGAPFVAEVRWDGSFVQSELELDREHLEPLAPEHDRGVPEGTGFALFRARQDGWEAERDEERER